MHGVTNTIIHDGGRSWIPIALLLAVPLVTAYPAAASTLRAPGFTWGEIRYPSSEQPIERDNLLIEGALDQGLDVAKLSERTRVNLFGRLNYKADTEELDYNNKLAIGAGVRLLHQVTDSAVVGAGLRYEVDHRFRSGQNLDGVTLFLNGFASWQLNCRLCSEGSVLNGRPLPGLIWAELRSPASHDPTENDDVLLEGAMEQGIDWMAIGDRGALNTFVHLGLKADTQGLDYYRSVTGGLGIKLKLAAGRNGLVQIGAKYTADHRWETGATEHLASIFLNWSTSWDALIRRQDLPR